MPFLSSIRDATRLWWQAWISSVLLCVLWLLFQIPIVTGPPATAVLYSIGYRIFSQEVWDTEELWTDFRRLFFPAWIWAAPYAAVTAVLVWNLLAFQGNQGVGWVGVRAFWWGVLLVWQLLNVVYWPFWLAQEVPTWRQTYANAIRFLRNHPGGSLFLGLISAPVVGFSLITVLPIPAGLPMWPVFLSIVFVSRSIHSR